MRLLGIGLFFFWSSLVFAKNIKVMTFNTMCSVCDLGSKEEPYRQRIDEIADTVLRHDPDLISFQEFTFRGHVKYMMRALISRYYSVYKKDGIYPASDTVLFVKRGRFKTIDSGGVWLGKNKNKFNFGWKFGIPRRFQYVAIEDVQTGRQFIFSGSHFDNSFKNKNASAAFVQEFFKAQTLPVIFASDTNLQPDYDGYKILLGDNMRNTFDESAQLTVTQNGTFKTIDLCHDRVGASWPLCRIDHVLMSKNAPWKVKSWGEDLFKYYKGEKFVSDHRAVIVELE